MTSDRVLLTVGMLLAVALIYLLMLKGWRGRQQRQSDLPEPPEPPAVPGEPLLPAQRGLFVGTTFADDWLDRVAVHDLAHRAAGWLLVATDGVHVEREGLADLYLPYDVLVSATLGDALAGKVIGKQGLLLLEWHLGARTLTSGFRADDHATHRRLADAITARLPSASPTPPTAAPPTAAPPTPAQRPPAQLPSVVAPQPAAPQPTSPRSSEPS